MKMISRLVRGLGRRALVASLAACTLTSVASANNVEVLLEGELLKVFGDNVANDIIVIQNAQDITIRGRNGTLINGLPSVRLRGVVLNAAEIRMEGGNDRVNLRGLAPANDLYVSLGAGNDLLVTGSPVTVGANASIEGNEGTDTIRLTDMTVFEDLYVDGGTGTLRATISGLDGGKGVSIIGDDAQDIVDISNSTAADFMSIKCKGGNNRVSVTGSFAFGLAVSTDFGADQVTISDFMALEDVGIFTGKGNDTVMLTNLSSGKSLTVSVDEGNDMVSGDNVTVAEDAVFEGGAGFDVLEDLGISGGIKKDIKEFESVL